MVVTRRYAPIRRPWEVLTVISQSMGRTAAAPSLDR